MSYGGRMRDTWIIFSVCLLAISASSCFLIPKQSKNQVNQPPQVNDASFFVSVPITQCASIGAPYLDVQVGNEVFSLGIDLGLEGDLSIASALVERIPSKTFIRTKLMYGFRGKEYQTSLYRIPKITIGTMSFKQPILQESSDEFHRDSVIVKKGKPSPKKLGRVGWELFYNSNLLLDIKNSKVAFCDSLNTLHKQGYLVKSFTKAPLLLERGLVEFEAQTTEGALRCMLDTGTTCNILNTELDDGKSIEQVIWEPENALTYPSFKIGNKDFGSVVFHRFPIKIPIRIGAILGMEFFQDHLVFLDFAGGYVYFSNQRTNSSQTHCSGQGF
ncbi:MAG: hypothetical protein HY861_03605 [Chlamydiia bacterium]|nr:hypothetical protein [Chlamydiia bacterium]